MNTTKVRALSPQFLRHLCLPLLLFLASPASGVAQEGGRLTFEDLMKVRQIQQPSISSDGGWVALSAVPDRGDGEVLVYATEGDVQYSIPFGTGPVFAAGGTWVAARVQPSFELRETSEPADLPKPGLAVLNTRTGELSEWEGVRSFGFSGDGGWLARHLYAPEAEEPLDEAGGERPGAEGEGARVRR